MDKHDKALLRELQADASQSNAVVGEKIGLSPSQISRRRARLETQGIISAYRAIVDPIAMEMTLNAFVKVRLHAHSAQAAAEFKALVTSLSAVRLACSITGDADYLLHIRVKDLAALSSIISEQLLPHPQVSEVRSDIVLDMIKDDASIPVTPG